VNNILLYLLPAVVVIAVLSEWLARRGYLSVFTLRKAIHIIVSGVCIYAFAHELDYRVLSAIGAVASGVLFFVIRSGQMLSVESQERKSWGIVFFALAFTFNAFFIYPVSPEIAIFSAFLVGFSDPFAAIIGRNFPFYPVRLTGDRKTLSGALAFALTIPAIALFSDIISPTPIFYPLDATSVLFMLYSAIVFSAVELTSSRGSDNLTLTMFSSAILWAYVFIFPDEIHWLTTFGLSVLVAWLAHRFRLLSLSGSVMTFIMAFFIFGTGEWKWTLPLFTFFVLSSLLSKLKTKRNPEAELVHEKTGIRDYKQVLANGGLPSLILLFGLINGQTDSLYGVYLVAIAAATSDTWSTEFGGIFRGKTVNIIGFQPIREGLSGGVSFWGTIGGLLGSMVIAFFALPFSEFSIFHTIGIAFFGFTGTIIDSIFGALYQVKYINPDGELTEKRKFFDLDNQRYSGLVWMNNDVVNLMSTTLSSVVYFIWLWTVLSP